MKRFQHILYKNGLSLAMFGFFLVFLIGQSIAGYQNFLEEQESHRQPPISYISYLSSGDFIEAVFENWESEFLQLGFYVLLTAFLYQRGSSESKDPDQANKQPEPPGPDAPRPVQRGGIALFFYQNSLSIALLGLFVLSFVLHLLGGSEAYCQDQMNHGETCIPLLSYFLTPRFWFESLQNWQSEFLAMGVFIILSIFLRQKGSPESKPVASPNDATGD
ncbi:hypothetical protein EI42_05710 [Thermosporothrix hazakensis]|jgi:hypothetical protein|uniref:Uncharacterized protein n=1 Tax=Thermosporothrix hazakensis TaxID=644383 RepID=A0A326TW43_THEHA|nr:DUF6766 family protein [Thermosporothrix hazakensis]PZW21055.1 hypothetical protein EI42_05710 [Thermosporothrix hazakensis]GCE46377.1 membrane protein [Thermosporothrix hazakensis]